MPSGRGGNGGDLEGIGRVDGALIEVLGAVGVKQPHVTIYFNVTFKASSKLAPFSKHSNA